jgi:hypothetical protein
VTQRATRLGEEREGSASKLLGKGQSYRSQVEHHSARAAHRWHICWSLSSWWHHRRQGIPPGIPRSTSTARRTPKATGKWGTWCRFQPNRSLSLLQRKPSERWGISPNGDRTPECTDADRMCSSDDTFRSAGQPLAEFVTLYHSRLWRQRRKSPSDRPRVKESGLVGHAVQGRTQNAPHAGSFV